MTAKAVTISNNRIGPSDFARNLHFPTNPLHSFRVLPFKKRIYVLVTLLASAAALVLAISQAFGEGGQDNAGNTSSGNMSSSSNQQPPNQQPEQSTSNANNNSNATPHSTSNASNTSSTSITVNGQSVDVPQTGSYDKNMNVPGGDVHVSGNTSQSTTGGSASNSTSTNVEINSE